MKTRWVNRYGTTKYQKPTTRDIEKILTHSNTKYSDLLTFQYTIGQGNNSELVRKVLQNKSNWIEIENEPFQYCDFNFNWQPTSFYLKYERIFSQRDSKVLVNHFEFHKELTSKYKLIKNLEAFAKTSRV